MTEIQRLHERDRANREYQIGLLDGPRYLRRLHELNAPDEPERVFRPSTVLLILGFAVFTVWCVKG